MLVSKAAIRDELVSRLAEFAPRGEHLQGLFVDERGQIPFDDSTGAPIYVLLTTIPARAAPPDPVQYPPEVAGRGDRADRRRADHSLGTEGRSPDLGGV